VNPLKKEKIRAQKLPTTRRFTNERSKATHLTKDVHHSNNRSIVTRHGARFEQRAKAIVHPDFNNLVRQRTPLLDIGGALEFRQLLKPRLQSGCPEPVRDVNGTFHGVLSDGCPGMGNPSSSAAFRSRNRVDSRTLLGSL